MFEKGAPPNYNANAMFYHCRGQLLFPSHKRLFSLTKALIVETFEKNKNIFVSPIASFVNHCYVLPLLHSDG